MCIHAKVKVFQFLGKFYSPPLWHLFMLFSSPYGSIQYSPCSVGKVEQHLESVDRACPRANIASDLSNVKATLSCCYFLERYTVKELCRILASVTCSSEQLRPVTKKIATCWFCRLVVYFFTWQIIIERLDIAPP
jgi:hypothetical protein